MLHSVLLIDRNRPQSTRVNKRFLSRTVASATLNSRPTRGGASHKSVNCQSCDDDDNDDRQHHKQQQQQHQLRRLHTSAGSQHGQRRMCTDSIGQQRKRSQTESDSRQSDTDRHSSSHVYDVHDYIRLNEEYKLDKKRRTTDSHSVDNRMNVKRH